MARTKTVTVRIDVESDRLARVASACTGETKPELISRLLREHCPAIVATWQARQPPPTPAPGGSSTAEHAEDAEKKKRR